MKKAILLAFAGASLLLAGCGGTPETVVVTSTVTTTPPEPTADPAHVAWLDGYCSALTGVLPESDKDTSGTSFNDFKNYVGGQLDDYITRFGRSLDGMKALPPAPLPELKTMYDKAFTPLSNAHTMAVQAKADLDKVRNGNYDGVNKASEKVSEIMKTAFPNSGPGKPPTDPALEPLFKASTKCSGMVVIGG